MTEQVGYIKTEERKVVDKRIVIIIQAGEVYKKEEERIFVKIIRSGKVFIRKKNESLWTRILSRLLE